VTGNWSFSISVLLAHSQQAGKGSGKRISVRCGMCVVACRDLPAPRLGWQLPAREDEAPASAPLRSGLFWLKVRSLFLFLRKCLKCFVGLHLTAPGCCCLLACPASGHQIFGFIRPEFHHLVHAEQDECQKPEAPADGCCNPSIIIHARRAAHGRLRAEVCVWWQRNEVS